MTNPMRKVTRRDSLRVWNCEITGLPKGIAKTMTDGGILPGFLKCVDVKEDGTLVFEYVTRGPEGWLTALSAEKTGRDETPPERAGH